MDLTGFENLSGLRQGKIHFIVRFRRKTNNSSLPLPLNPGAAQGDILKCGNLFVVQ